MASEPISIEEAAGIGARVFALVRACPAGRVTTYGWIAAALGYRGGGGARMVGWYLNEVTDEHAVPAHRVINSKGELTGSWAFGKTGRMHDLLVAEGVAFTTAGRVDLKRYGWDPVRDLREDERVSLFEQAPSAESAVTPRLLRLLREDPASPVRPAQE